MTYIVTPVEGDPGKMKWYGTKNGNPIYQSPTGRLYVVPKGAKNPQKVALEGWARDGYR